MASDRSNSLVMLGFHWFGYDSQNLEYAIISFNTSAMILSLPISLFVVPVLVASNYYMAMSPFAGDGMYLNTLFLAAIGAMQWFWVAKFWSQGNRQFQRLELYDAK